MAIDANKKIKFVHMPKCAGSSISRYLKKYSNATILHHYKKINDDHLNNDTMWVSNIRNPFEIYPSFWIYRSYGHDKKNFCFEHLPENCKSSPNATLKSKKEAFKNWLNFIILDYKSPGNNFKGGKIDFGLVTQWAIIYWFGRNKSLFESEYLNTPDKNYVITNYIRKEHIEYDLKEILGTNSDIIVPSENKGKEIIDYREFFDKEMIEMIYSKDIYIFKKFKYDIESYFK